MASASQTMREARMRPSAVVPHPSPEDTGVIRTPDQRLRVFVSSTLGELAAERTAVKGAIERLRLAPVMFELGARAHPPRTLYRAYVEQSHVFVGVYWESYGWVAPEMAISGIEDEYELASGLPCLVYVKEPAPARDGRLTQFLERVEADGRVSYKRFQTAEQLAELIADDLALLLTEHFETAEVVPSGTLSLRPRPLPIAPTRLVGRESDLETVCTLIERDDVRLVTLSGMGGIGKTRLALAAADRLRHRFDEGVGFADLSSVRNTELVPGAVADALGIPREGTRPVAEQVIEALASASLLVVLDNFEHLLAAAPFVVELLAGCPGIKVVVTSRALLRLRGEHELAVMPLAAPRTTTASTVNGALDAPAVRLFIERAQDRLPQFEATGSTAQAVIELCTRLEGIPLAIELAAARIRVLPPTLLLQRIGDRLDLLSGPSDLPERQQTLRATIDWSYDLLEAPDRELYARLSVFAGGFTLDSAQAVCDGDIDVLEGISSLIEKSLVHAQDRPDVEPRFRMLETVRQYAQDRLERSGDAEKTRLRMVQYFAELSDRAGPGLSGYDHRMWLARLDAEVDNLRAAILWADEQREPNLLLRLISRPWTYWWQAGYMPELQPIVEQSLERYPSLPPRDRVLQLHAVAAIRNTCGAPERAIPVLEEVIGLARSLGDLDTVGVAEWALATYPREPLAEQRQMMTRVARTLRERGNLWLASFAHSSVLVYALADGDVSEAERQGEEALELARAIDSDSATGIALQTAGYSAFVRGDLALARARFARGADAYGRARDAEGRTYSLDGLAAVALAQGKSEVAARAMGSADATRERIGAVLYPMIERTFRRPFVAAVQGALGAAAFGAARRAGSELDLDAALEEVLRATQA